MPSLPDPRQDLATRAASWPLLAVAAGVTVVTVGVGAVLVEPAPGRLVATDDGQIAELTGARPVNAARSGAPEVLGGTHLRRHSAKPSPASGASSSQGSPSRRGPGEQPLNGAPGPEETDPRPGSDPSTSEPSPLVTTEPEPDSSPAPSPSGGASPTSEPTSAPTSDPDPTPEPEPERDPWPPKPSWWPW
ncbi:hypothetical protein [Nocardioides pacificus]